MIKNLALNKALFLTTGMLSLVAAVIGVLDPGMYDPVVSARIMPGVFTQDLLVIVAALVMILRYGAAGYGVFIAVMFNFIWISRLS